MVGEIHSSDQLHFQLGVGYLSSGNLVVSLLLGGYCIDTNLNRHLINMAHYNQELLDSRDLLASVSWVAETTGIQDHNGQYEQLCMP